MHDKDLCPVCRMSWADHGLGGNCLSIPHWLRNEEGPGDSVNRYRAESKKKNQKRSRKVNVV